MRRVSHTLVLAVLLGGSSVQAQEPVTPPPVCTDRIDLTSSVLSDTRRSLWRALSITAAAEESGFFRSSSHGMSACAAGSTFLRAWRAPTQRVETDPPPGTGRPRVELLPLQVSAQSNSAYPRSANDGAGCQGV